MTHYLNRVIQTQYNFWNKNTNAFKNDWLHIFLEWDNLDEMSQTHNCSSVNSPGFFLVGSINLSQF